MIYEIKLHLKPFLMNNQSDGCFDNPYLIFNLDSLQRHILLPLVKWYQKSIKYNFVDLICV